MLRAGDRLPPLHPGEMVREEFLVPLDLAPGALAEAMGVPEIAVQSLLDERAPITGDLALRLSRALGCSPEFWLNLQTSYELEVARDAADWAALDAIPSLNPQASLAAE